MEYRLCFSLSSVPTFFLLSHRENARASMHAKRGPCASIAWWVESLSKAFPLHHALFSFPCYRVPPIITTYLSIAAYSNKPNCVGIIATSDGSLLMQEDHQRKGASRNIAKAQGQPARSSRGLTITKDDGGNSLGSTKIAEDEVESPASSYIQ